MVLLEVSASTHADIVARITALGPIYVADFIVESLDVGLIIRFGEVGLVVERAASEVDS